MNRNSCSPSVRRPAFRPSGLPAFLRPMKSHLLSRSALRSLNLEGEEKKRDSCSPSSRKQQTACVRPSGLPAFRPPGLPASRPSFARGDLIHGVHRPCLLVSRGGREGKHSFLGVGRAAHGGGPSTKGQLLANPHIDRGVSLSRAHIYSAAWTTRSSFPLPSSQTSEKQKKQTV